MFSLIFAVPIVIFLLTSKVSGNVDELQDVKDYQHPLACKSYPKSDYGYKTSMSECLHSENQRILPWNSHKPSCGCDPNAGMCCLKSKPADNRKEKHCSELTNCGYGYPESFDGRVLNPYNNTITGFIPKSCAPLGYVNSKGRHYCDRKCGKEKRICYYRLNVESAETHHPYYCSKKCQSDKNCAHEKCIRTDGVRTVVIVYNYMIPGPTIAVCVGDKVVVDIVNHLNDFRQIYISDKAIEKNVKDDMRIFKVKDGMPKARRIVEDIFLRHMNRHHYLRQSPQNSTEEFSTQSAASTPPGDPIIVPDYSKPGEDTTCHFHGFFMAANPHADGPHFVTQNGIQNGQIYRNSFIADTAGTLLYHSHTGMQRSLGCVGRLTVRTCNDPHSKLFDYDETEHSVMFTDFGYNNSHNLDTLLVNSFACNRNPNATHLGYVTMLEFKRNKRYRVRFTFNGITTTKLRCFIIGQRFLMTAVDGHPIEPEWVDSWVLANGERVEGILKLLENKLLVCYPLRNNQKCQFGNLYVKGEPPPPTCKELLKIPIPPPTPSGIEYNTENAVPGTNGTITTSELRGLANLHELCRQRKVEQIFVDMIISGRGLQMNNITDEMPKEAYLCQYFRKGSIDESNLCNAETFKKKGINCGAPNVTCRCNHIIKVQENRCYEFILTGTHPFHLHGYAFYVIAQGKTLDNTPMTQEKFHEYDRQGLVKRNLENPPQKDTVTTPAQGYTVIRVATTNPGFWKAHCHIELHGVSGMSFTLWVQSKNENFKKRMGNHVCDPFPNNVCTGKYVKMKEPPKSYK